MKKILLVSLLITLFLSCSTQQYVATSMKGEYIPVTGTNNPDKRMADTVAYYKHRMQEVMGQVIGSSAQYMVVGKPESLLTNFTSDVMLGLDTEYTGGQPVDLTMMNVHGHRSPVPEGDITVGDVFSTYSFENELVVVRIKGSNLKEVFDGYAGIGGAGISGNVKLVIKDKQLQDAKINGLPVDRNKTYTVVTLDYLAEGNDGMKALKKAESVTSTGLTLRDFMMDYIKAKAKNGEKIASKVDGRIIIE
ncbi:MAG: 5'-nucleotidase C-terminal domain-containing protein [Prevotella sp.]|jgi:2',3'-cyclic-nucleotide 2'-phosphodiesterase (5'-nucleotidase family)|nr:5'-nucleotidase C-terminal domain-containing protein [Prevotella sp.]